MTGQYAKDTSVTVEKSQAEVEKILMRYGADAFMRGWESGNVVLAFRMDGKRMKFELPMPNKDEFRHTSTGKLRTSDAAINEAWEQGCRQRWRALKLVIQAKLEAVEVGISTLEDEFMAQILLPNGDTIGNWMKPHIEEMYLTAKMPPMLPSGGGL